MKNEAELFSRVKLYEPLWDGWFFNNKQYGSGGSGCVLGLSRNKERSVVKVIYIEDNQLKYKAVKDEIETMVTLRSENLVECLNYRIEEVYNKRGEKIGYDFLIHMNEYEPFSEFLREEEYDPNDICVQLTKEIGGALCVLHSNGILHRDIKPENIFIDNSSGERHFRLGDFGVSKRIGDMSGLTTTGTLNFMAPESFKYYEYSYRSDIYNLGMTLYYILNDLRFPVFSEEESQSDFDYNTECRLHGEKLPKPKYGSETLVKVVMKCCEANPKDRYKDISETLDELFGQNFPKVGIKLKTETGSIPTKKRTGKKLIIMVFVGIIVLLIISIIFLFLINQTQSSPPSQNSNKDINTPSDMDSINFYDMDIEKSIQSIVFKDSDSFPFELCYTKNETIIIIMSSSSLKNSSNECKYECFFSSEGELMYIYTEQDKSSYRITINNDCAVKVIEGGISPKTYYKDDERITDKYQTIINEAKTCYDLAKKETNNFSFKITSDANKVITID